MNFNNAISVLRKWCVEKAANEPDSLNIASEPNLRKVVFEETSLKLASFTDRDFESFQQFKCEILKFKDDFFGYWLNRELSDESKLQVGAANDDFFEHLDSLCAENLSAPESDTYFRILTDDEAEALARRLNDVWQYNVDNERYPLTTLADNTNDAFFVDYGIIKHYWSDLCKIIKIPQRRIYTAGEYHFLLYYYAETNEICYRPGASAAFTDKDFTWFIYFL